MTAVIVQVPRGGPLQRQLDLDPPASVADGHVVVEHGLTDQEGVLEPAAGGEVVLSLPSPESLAREPDEVWRVIAQAGTGVQPLVVEVQAAEQLREEELTVLRQAADHTSRPVILRVIRNA
jgi:hypothetical protein